MDLQNTGTSQGIPCGPLADWPKNKNKCFHDLIYSVPFLPAILGLSVCQGHASIAAITVLILDGT